jgi:acyl carrier protein
MAQTTTDKTRRRHDVAVPTTQLREIVVGAIAKAAEMAPDEITDELNLFDLGLDSLNLADILIDIEDGVGAEIPVEVMDRFLDVGDNVTIRDVLGVLAAWNPQIATDAGAPLDYGGVVVVDEGM